LAILIDSFNNKKVKICRISKKKIYLKSPLFLICCLPLTYRHHSKSKDNCIKICRISKKKIFSSQIAMPAAMQEWYSKSYFGYVLLAELFKGDVKKLFLNDWA
jgi:hypothetical protein